MNTNHPDDSSLQETILHSQNPLLPQLKNTTQSLLNANLTVEEVARRIYSNDKGLFVLEKAALESLYNNMRSNRWKAVKKSTRWDFTRDQLVEELGGAESLVDVILNYWLLTSQVSEEPSNKSRAFRFIDSSRQNKEH